jgi:hypothetical protein
MVRRACAVCRSSSARSSQPSSAAATVTPMTWPAAMVWMWPVPKRKFRWMPSRGTSTVQAMAGVHVDRRLPKVLRPLRRDHYDGADAAAGQLLQRRPAADSEPNWTRLRAYSTVSSCTCLAPPRERNHIAEGVLGLPKDPRPGPEPPRGRAADESCPTDTWVSGRPPGWSAAVPARRGGGLHVGG